ncbi:hypothetical protein [Halococcus thailandensis]|uniref:hypothetical protein n=1 Tax=Halococcus thailandensis TaxID=335952 RepID=UPI001269697D|nr:hypothetical protein [Halococcus thailandensis]
MTAYTTLEEWICDENGEMPSCADQITTGYWFLNHNCTVNDDNGEVRTSFVRERVEHRLDHEIRGVLGNLEEIDVLVEVPPPGAGGCIRHHRTDEVFFSPSKEEYVPYLDEEVSRFLDDMHAQEETQTLPTPDGGVNDSSEPVKTLRSVAANALNDDASSVEDELTEPSDSFERMLSYDDVVKAIKQSDDVSRDRDYDEMGWRNFALKWTLSQRAVRIERNESLTTD